jgi:hypothetical protein
MRSWLPSYANLSRLVPALGKPGAPPQCYIQLHRSDAPRWHCLLGPVAAGRLSCEALPAGAAHAQEGAWGGAPALQAGGGRPACRRDLGGGEAGEQQPAGQLTGEQEQQAGGAAAGHQRAQPRPRRQEGWPEEGAGRGQAAGGRGGARMRLAPLPERGALSLWQSTRHAEVFRLVWSKRSEEGEQHPAPAAQPDEIPLGSVQLALSAASVLERPAGADERVLAVAPAGGAAMHYFWLQQAYGHAGLRCAAALAARVAEALASPPAYDPLAAGHMFSSGGAGRVVQLGPLPVSLLREVLAAGGWDAAGDTLSGDGSGVLNVSLQAGGQQQQRAGRPAGGAAVAGSAAAGAASPAQGRCKGGGMAGIRGQVRRLSLGSSPPAGAGLGGRSMPEAGAALRRQAFSADDAGAALEGAASLPMLSSAAGNEDGEAAAGGGAGEGASAPPDAALAPALVAAGPDVKPQGGEDSLLFELD